MSQADEITPLVRLPGRCYDCVSREQLWPKLFAGYAKDKAGNLVLIGAMTVAHSKDKSTPRERKDKRHLVRQGATVFKKESAG